MTKMAENLLRWVPVVVLAAGIVSSAAVAQFQLQAIAQEVEDQSESIDENEEQIDALQMLLLRQQGEQKQEITEIQGDIKLILRLLQENDQ